jgi:2-polyprenyl-3-methyl-5-hydroxy-6-metoxy-1,4-benzoquinol methylase
MAREQALQMTQSFKARQSAAIQAVEERLKGSPHWDYWKCHKKRFEHAIGSILKTYRGQEPEKIRILDVGSHFLQLSSILVELGFSVEGADVEEFTNDPLIRSRAEKAGIDNYPIDDLKEGQFSAGNEAYDLILFTETLEHLPFNPKKMWQKFFSLLRPGGSVFVTTPNSVGLRKLPIRVAKLIFREGFGPSLDQILCKPIFGTHWKEYSPRELKRYFPMLEMSAETRISFYRHQPILRSWSLIDWSGAFLNLCAELIPPLREEMEIWITPIETG